MGDSDHAAPPSPWASWSRQIAVGPVDLKPLVPSIARSAYPARDISWPVVLLPDFLFGRDAMPADSVEVYQHVDWEAPVPSDPFVATMEPVWSARRSQGAEYELRTEAIIADRRLASSTIVCRTGDALPEHGQARTYPAPLPGELEVVRQMTITEGDVQEFCDYSQAHYAVSASMGDARSLGFRNLLVPGPLLALMHVGASPSRPSEGSIDVWFRGPVTAGSAMSMCHSKTDPNIWSIRAVGAVKPATVAVIATRHVDGRSEIW